MWDNLYACNDAASLQHYRAFVFLGELKNRCQEKASFK